MGEILLQLAHLGLRPDAPPGGNRAAEMGVGGGRVAAGQRETPCQLVRQGVDRVKPALPREPHRFFILLQRDAVHAVQTDDFGINQRLFIGKRARIDPRPEGNFVVMVMNTAAIIRRKGFRRELAGERQRAVKMVIQQMNMTRRGPRIPARHF